MQKLPIAYVLSRIVFIVALSLIALQSVTVFAFSNLPGFDDNSPLTKDLSDVIDPAISEAEDPLRLGANIAGKPLDQGQREGLIYRGIDTTQEARKVTVDVVRKVVNYALGLIGLVSLLYLLYHGFLALTAGDDDAQYEKGVAGVKYALIAIAGVAIAWFILSLIYWMITLLTTD